MGTFAPVTMPGRRLLLLLLALPCAVALAPAQAQIAFRSATSAIGPATGTIAHRASTSATGGSIVFRAAATSATGAPLATPQSPVFRQVASATAASGVLTLVINVPAGTLQNDVMIAAIAVRPSSAVITAPAGWTLVDRTNNPGPTDSNSLAVYSRVAGAIEPSNYAWTFSTSTGAAGGIQSFSGVDIVSPIDGKAAATSGGPGINTHDAPSITTTSNGAMVVAHFTKSAAGGWTPPPAGGGMPVFIESFDVNTGGGANGQSLEGTRAVQPAAGPTGTKTATAAPPTDAGVTHMLALRPALRIPVPAGVAEGDLLLAGVAVAPHTATISAPGWTLVRRTDNAAANANSLAVYWRFAGSAEPSSYIFGIGGGTAWVGGMQAYSGVDATTPIDVENGTTTVSGLPHTAPSITTTVTNTMAVTHHSMSSSATWTAPPGSGAFPAFSERYDAASLAVPNAAGVSLESASVVWTGASATGTKTATASANPDVGNAHILALKPAARAINIARPGAAVQNDFMIAAIGFAPHTATVTPPAGWALVQLMDNSSLPGGTSNALAIYRKVHTLTEPTSYTWTFSANVTVVGGIQAYSGVDIADPIIQAAGQGTPSAATHATPSIDTSPVANAMVVTHHTMNGQGNWAPPAAGGGMPVFTESFDVTTLGGATGQSLEGARALRALAGVTGAKTATSSASAANRDKGNAHILALRPLATTQFDIATPAGTAANDVLIAAIAFTPDTAVIAPAVPGNWTLIQRLNNTVGAGTNNSLAVYRRVATGAEPAAHAWTFGAVPTAVAGGIQAFSGVDPANPVVVANGQNTGSALTHATPSVNTSPVANTMLVTAHGYASSGTWSPPAGMAESYDRANLTTPNVAGVSIEGSRVEQGAAGATGVKTATASANADKGNAHIVALRPAPAVVPSGPSAFNGCESATCTPVAAPLTYAALYTKVAGTDFTLRGVALKSDGTLESGFAGSVTVDLLANVNTGVTLGADNCPTSQDATISLGSATFAAGRAAIAGINVANAYRDVRMRFSCTALVCGSAITRCSSDNFAIRPNSLSFTVTDSDWETAGTTRMLSNAAAPGGTTHKAGRLFTITATAWNGATPTPVVTTNYAGTPTASIVSYIIPSACLNGTACTLVGGAFADGTANDGIVRSSTARYDEVGAFNMQLVDTSFAAVDAADSTTAQRYITSAAVAVGRFVPDHFSLSSGTRTPACTAGGGVLSYMNQPFSLAATLVAQNSAGGTTENYDPASGGYAPAVVAWQAENANSGANLVTRLANVNINGAVASAWSNGSYVINSTTATFNRVAAPDGAYDNLQLGLQLTDPDGPLLGGLDMNASTGDDCVASSSCTAIAIGAPISVRYGRLRLLNAYGSELLPLRVPVRAEYYNGTTWSLSAGDSCTPLSSTMGSLAYGTAGTPLANTNFRITGTDPNTGAGTTGNWMTTSSSVLSSGAGTIVLNKPCVPGTPCTPAVGSADLTLTVPAWLLNLPVTARVRFGSPKAPYIYLRERY